MAIRTNGEKRGLLFGDFIVAAYEAWGRRRAKGLAVSAKLVELHGGLI
jgi:hypothetical protein